MSASKTAPKSQAISPILWYLFIALMVITYMPNMPDPAQLPRTIVLGIFNIALAVSAFMLLKTKTLKIHWGLWAALAWVAYLAYLIPGSVNGIEAFTEFFRYGIAVFFFLIAHILIEHGMLSRTLLVRGFLLIAALMCLYGLAQVIPLLGKRDFFIDVVEVKSFTGNKNLLSATLALCLPLIHYAHKTETGWLKKTAQYSFWAILVILALVHTRSIWLGMVLALFIGLPFFLNWRKNSEDQVFKPLGFAVAIILFLGILAASFPTMSDTTNLNHRLRFWQNSVEMVKENPLGVGAGNWKVWFPKYGIDAMDATVTDGETTVAEPHNDYLWILTESGIPGFALQLLLFAAVLIHLLRNIKVHENDDKLFYIMLLMGMVAFLTFSFFDFPMERPELQMMFFLVCAFALSGSTAFGKSISLPKLIIILPIVFSAYGAHVSYQKFQGEKISADVWVANARKDAQRIIPLAQKAESDYFITDRYGNPMPYYEGLGYMARGMEAECYAAFQRALEFAPYSIITLNQLGNYHKRRKEFDKAESYYQRALDISPHFTAGLLNLAEINAMQGNHREALRSLNQIYYYRWDDPTHTQKAVFLMANTLRSLRDAEDTPPGIQKFFSRIAPELSANDALLAREYNNFRKQRAAEVKRQERGM